MSEESAYIALMRGYAETLFSMAMQERKGTQNYKALAYACTVLEIKIADYNKCQVEIDAMIQNKTISKK